MIVSSSVPVLPVFLLHLKLQSSVPRKKVLIVDRGKEIDKRACPARITGKCVCCDPCAIVNGWSGAGAFSDGKLSLSPEVGGHISEYIGTEKAQALINYADGIYRQFGAPDVIHGQSDKAVEESI